MESSWWLLRRDPSRRSRYSSHGESRDIPLSRIRKSCGVCHRVPDRFSGRQEQARWQRWRPEARRGTRMTLSCPRCHTAFVVTRRRAQTAAAALGGVAGAIRGASTAVAKAGEGPSHPLGIITGAILGGLLGGAAGCTAGSAIGAPIDLALPRNFSCQACGHIFDVDQTDPPRT